MAECKDCVHWEACKSIPEDFIGSAERCDTFVPTADVVPKSEVSKEFTCFVGDPHKVESCPYIDEIEKAKSEVEKLEYEKQLLFDEGKAWYIEAELNAKRMLELNRKLDELAEEHSDLIVEKDQLFDIAEKQKVEIESLKIANEKMYSAIEETKAEVIEEYRQRVNAKMGKHTHLLGKEYVQRILR